MALCGELALEEAMDLSQDRLRHDDLNISVAGTAQSV
jgi:hypothetical protein